MQVLFSDKFKRQAELGEVGSRDIMELVARITSDYNVLFKYHEVWVESFKKTDDPEWDMMTRVEIKLTAISNDLTLASRNFTYKNLRSKDFGCMNIQIEKGDTL
jgi:hypothetical protein